MAKKLKPRQIAALQDEYIAKRQELLQKKVSGLQVSLFDRVYNGYLTALEQSDGNLTSSDQNYNLVKGLDSIYDAFIKQDNAPVVKIFVGDVQGVTPLNARYFKALTKQSQAESAQAISDLIDKRLGIDTNGQPVPKGFVDKFIQDKTLLKTIKKTTTKAITNNMGFQELRDNLKTVIEGDPAIENSGGLHQYYRNFAYNTLRQADIMSATLFAKDLGLNYFYWSGPEIKTSRPLCILLHNKIIDNRKWSEVTDFTQLKLEYQQGMDENSDPSQDLGGYGCIHRKRFVLDAIAELQPGSVVDVNSLLA